VAVYYGFGFPFANDANNGSDVLYIRKFAQEHNLGIHFIEQLVFDNMRRRMKWPMAFEKRNGEWRMFLRQSSRFLLTRTQNCLKYIIKLHLLLRMRMRMRMRM